MTLQFQYELPKLNGRSRVIYENMKHKMSNTNLILWTSMLFGSISNAGCGTPEHDQETASELDDTSEVASAVEVLNFSPSAWNAGDGTALQFGHRAIIAESSGVHTLKSARFFPDSIPNQFAVSIRALDNTRGTRSAELRVIIGCFDNGRAGEVVVQSQEFMIEGSQRSQVTVSIPQSVQETLATDCPELSLKLDMNVSGSFEIDDLRLRAGTPSVVVDDQPFCALPSIEPLVAIGKKMPTEHYDFEAWLVNPAAQKEVRRYHDVLDDFAEYTLGSTLDHFAKQLVIAVDPDAWMTVKGDLIAALESGDVNLPIRIQPGCTSLTALKQAEQKINARLWHPAVEFAAYSVSLDVSRGKWVVMLNPSLDGGGAEEDEMLGRRVAALEVQDVASALIFGHENAIAIEYGAVGRSSRTTDTSPHRGGAAIHPTSVALNSCTAGFVVGSGVSRSTVTAAHCFLDDQGMLVNSTVKSGTAAYGFTSGFPAFPANDMARIFVDVAAGQSFLTSIHTGPSAPTTRTQTGKWNLLVNETYCNSGFVSGAVCGMTVNSLTGQLCDAAGCTTGLATGTKADNSIFARPGDSGAPVYARDGATGATIHGMHIGADNGGRRSYFHTVSSIEARLGVTVAQ